MSDLLRAISVKVILNDKADLLGAAHCAALMASGFPNALDEVPNLSVRTLSPTLNSARRDRSILPRYTPTAS